MGLGISSLSHSTRSIQAYCLQINLNCCMYAARSSSFGTFNWATHFEMVCLGAGLSTAITSSSHCLQVVALSLISPFPPSAFYLKILSCGAVDGGSMVSVAMDWILWNTMLARPAMLHTMPPHYYYLSTSIGSHRHYAFKSSRGWCPRVLE